MSRPRYCGQKAPQYPLVMRLSGQQSRCGHSGVVISVVPFGKSNHNSSVDHPVDYFGLLEKDREKGKYMKVYAVK